MVNLRHASCRAPREVVKKVTKKLQRLWDIGSGCQFLKAVEQQLPSCGMSESEADPTEASSNGPTNVVSVTTIASNSSGCCHRIAVKMSVCTKNVSHEELTPDVDNGLSSTTVALKGDSVQTQLYRIIEQLR